MPPRDKKPCAYQMCPNLAEGGEKYCMEHNEFKIKENRDRNRSYDKYKRDKEIQRFYKSKEWELTRKLRLMADSGLCKQCKKDNKITFADVVHHIVEVKQDYNKRLEINNLESLCNSCHNKVHKSTPPILEVK